DTVHANAPSRVLDGRHSGEVDHAGLRRIVGADGKVGEETGDRRGVHDGPAPALEQLGEGTLGGAKDAGEPDVDDVRPHVVVELAGEGEPALPRGERRLPEGVVVQDIEATERLHGTAHHGLDACGSARVESHRSSSGCSRPGVRAGVYNKRWAWVS